MAIFTNLFLATLITALCLVPETAEGLPMKKACLLPEAPGPCYAFLVHYFYNSKKGICQPFVFGGCHGNANNFPTLKLCNAACRPKRPRKGVQMDKKCLLPKRVGHCRAAFPRFYFNANTERCEGFIYGGCYGNANNFHTKADCQTACK